MIIDYTVSITSIISGLAVVGGGILAFGQVIGRLKDLSTDLAKLDSVPISIATHDLRLINLEARIASYENRLMAIERGRHSNVA